MLKLASIKANQEEFNSDIANSIDRKITVSVHYFTFSNCWCNPALIQARNENAVNYYSYVVSLFFCYVCVLVLTHVVIKDW